MWRRPQLDPCHGGKKHCQYSGVPTPAFCPVNILQYVGFIWQLHLPLVGALTHPPPSGLGCAFPASPQQLHHSSEPHFPLPKLRQLFPGTL